MSEFIGIIISCRTGQYRLVIYPFISNAKKGVTRRLKKRINQYFNYYGYVFDTINNVWYLRRLVNNKLEDWIITTKPEELTTRYNCII